MRYTVREIEGKEYQVFKLSELTEDDVITLFDEIGIDVEKEDDNFPINQLERDEEFYMNPQDLVIAYREQLYNGRILIEIEGVMNYDDKVNG